MSTPSQGGDFTERELDLYMMRLLAGWKTGIEKKFKLPDANSYPNDACAVNIMPKLRAISMTFEAPDESVKCDTLTFTRHEYRTLGGVHVRLWVKDS